LLRTSITGPEGVNLTLFTEKAKEYSKTEVYTVKEGNNKIRLRPEIKVRQQPSHFLSSSS
jgi:hypothetical protein